MKFASIEIGETVAVFGAGPIGLVTIACARLAGAGPHLGGGNRWRTAARWRSKWAPPWRSIRTACDVGGRNRQGYRRPRRWIAPIDCAAKQSTTNDAIRAVRNGGRVVLTGIHSASFVPFEVSPMRRKELAIFNVRRSNSRIARRHRAAARAHCLVRPHDHPYARARSDRPKRSASPSITRTASEKMVVEV